MAKATTGDGYKVHFGTNYLSHALLINLLLPTMQRTFNDAELARQLWEWTGRELKRVKSM
ncbi:hypothetical protein ASPZODRAFT_131832 [Penicilliopsis zonata CBS 506.65]|uniref:Uncharacterized protein n=1 Tax=Penicilliopsis zonata CBS 506.65 TaxID=1073090 RepID=A0A1L9SIL5_9EURO|nr:hypothetical protein ASPZODRAFT_131832 [Penicilliopsis zonata CBS 506.65]OJJ46923.1 hypothetical protein ASPZODRAFT_131832 [Penicilliopsis zonata CBS 506.65]